MAAGLLEETANFKIDPIEELIFYPDNKKVDFTHYFKVLRTSESLHELILGAISIKMLSEKGILIYQPILKKTIQDAVEGNSFSIL